MQSNLRKKLIQLFTEADGEFISGQKISEELGCSRTAVWKHIEELRKSGYELEAVRKLGYKMKKKPDKISEDEIRLGLKTEKMGQTIHFQDVVASTQKIAHELANNGAPEGTIVVADKQTEGRGRMSRAWHSPEGTGIWMSLILRPEIPVQKTPQLTLLAAVAIVQAIEEQTGIVAEIKWPNDILINGKKAVGILTELQAEADQVHSVIVGTGINVNQHADDFPGELQETATSLRIESGEKIDRAALIQTILLTFEKRYSDYLTHGFKPIKLLWESYAITLHRQLTARTLSGTFHGKALGIDDEGVLLLETSDGIKKIYSADIEINPS
ncbi:bifunctional biotin--[acetyl-CoA-carboxylase] synthetase/biotin operon repressor [Bacillus sonorensis]|uniref:Bifunctional ligase/repressor BirA n=2 Tax=Bacillus sonorensis TaxID=119858 RepID=M5PAE4_9BACI|nr:MULTISPECIES: bifunctional biotin--[acetyl-CoA-carboxylase] synthetase/biotin operon repressor [Bacillus]TWK82536.1 Bifunctional ligase/repressor BirA [Bacillus paralicheniformis]ASB88733.1 Biotin--[acetyl-CoA-carboxylase] ligase [Bacillus sonorensis]EME76458.1 trigger enzyme biotin-protein ligase BirA [Bacillus sonorensis L12]MBG9915462.1 biotin--acetyl-CoA-carboxylase ligase [Bacillus sonorensis]MCF7618087.1 bifunctional biotin--[acetyl-CoA-carboxylase] synthetase/biotin operon repressor 